MTIYNGLEPADRQDFKDVEYGPSRSGGILIGNQFVCSCGDEFTVLQDDRLNDFESLFHIGDDVHLKDRSGALFNTVCSKDGKSLKILDSELKVEPSVVELIEFNGQKWALSHDGRVYHTDQQSGLIRIGSVVESKSLQSKIWKRVQSLTVPALFLSDDRSNYLEAE